jgi:hypothetical protein
MTFHLPESREHTALSFEEFVDSKVENANTNSAGDMLRSLYAEVPYNNPHCWRHAELPHELLV